MHLAQGIFPQQCKRQPDNRLKIMLERISGHCIGDIGKQRCKHSPHAVQVSCFSVSSQGEYVITGPGTVISDIFRNQTLNESILHFCIRKIKRVLPYFSVKIRDCQISRLV